MKLVSCQSSAIVAQQDSQLVPDAGRKSKNEWNIDCAVVLPPRKMRATKKTTASLGFCSSAVRLVIFLIVLLAFQRLPASLAFLVPRFNRESILSVRSKDVDNDDEELLKSTFNINDGGADLTDRFKYKLNALMGVFDPIGDDDERQNGNILAAMIKFPARFSFNVVGRTDGDSVTREEYVQEVKNIVASNSGDEDGYECRITPRGYKFTKVQATVRVDSAAMIGTIYDELDALERTIMRF